MVRPKDLRLPFSWQERTIQFHDQCWLIPPQLERKSEPVHFSFPGFSAIFPSIQPVSIEYCSGHGHWITEKAQQFPQINWVAVEKQLVRVKKIWSKAKNLGLSNLIVVWGEGHSLTKQFLPSASVENIYINFPDPWPKRRHAPNRILQTPFLQELERILLPNGSLTVVTDDDNYSDQFLKEIAPIDSFRSTIEAPYFHCKPEDYGTSYFDSLFTEQDKAIRFHKFVKRPLQ